MKKRSLLALVLAGTMLVGTAFTGCGNSKSNNEQTVSQAQEKNEETKNDSKKGEAETKTAYSGSKVLNYYVSGEPQTLDCQKMHGQPDMFMANMFMEGLVRFGKEEGKYEPGVAKSWNYDDASMTWTFELNENAKWKDGTPITADDFIFSWRKALDDPGIYTFLITDYIDGTKEYGAFTKKGFLAEKDSDFKALVEKSADEKDKDKKKELNSQISDRISKMSEKQVAEFNSMKDELWKNVGIQGEGSKLSVKLETNCPYFLGLTAFCVFQPMNEEFFKAHQNNADNGYCLEAEGLNSNGPWIVKEWKHKESFKLVKNENYWNKDNINIDELNIKIIGDVSTRTNLLKTGELDGSAIQSTDLKEFEDMATLKQYNLKPLVNRSDYSVFYIEFNFASNEIVKNPNIRKAMAYALDRQTFVEKINLGDMAALAFVPEFFPGLEKSFREENGKKLFEDNQKEKAKEYLAKGLKELGLEKLPKLDVLMETGDISTKIFQKWQEDWNEIGIKVNLIPVPWGEKLSRLESGDFALCGAAWGPDYLDPMTFLNLFESTNGSNHGKYSNAEYDKLINEAKAEKDSKKRMEMLYAAEKHLIDNMVVVPTYDRMAHWTYKKYLTGVVNRGAGPSTDFYWADVDMDAKMNDK